MGFKPYILLDIETPRKSHSIEVFTPPSFRTLHIRIFGERPDP